MVALEEGQILVVHPDEQRRALLCKRLGEAGHATLAAGAAEEARTVLHSREPDLVVLHLDADGGKALDFITAMQADPVTAIIPTLLLAAPTDAVLVQQCMDRGADDFLFEPYSPAALKEMVRSYLELGSTRRQELRRSEREVLLKIERDVLIARQIQEGFLPDVLPQPAGWETAARFHPAREVAGDFYDGFELSQGRRIALVIADVCDKGVGAALFMALFRSLFRAYAQQNYSMRWADVLDGETSVGALPRQRNTPRTGTVALQNAMNLTNRYIAQTHADANMFATTFFGVLDPMSGRMTYVNGGHNPPVVIGAEGIKARLKPTGPAVGMFPDVDYAFAEITLDPGDVLFTFTDGVTDARDPAGAFFTEKHMLALLEQPAGTALQLVDRIDTALKEHIGSAPQFDDITMLAIRRSAAGV